MRVYLPCAVLAFCSTQAFSQRTDQPFTPIEPVPVAQIVNSSTAYPGGFYDVDNIIDGAADGSSASEYSSAGDGTDTFVDFDFGERTSLAAFKHVDRFDPATVAASQLTFSSTPDFSSPLAVLQIQHANTRGGLTFFAFPSVAARYARWQVTALGPNNHGTVGGSEITFYSGEKPEARPTRDTLEVTAFPLLKEKDGKRFQSLEVCVRHPYREVSQATIELTGTTATPIQLDPVGVSVELDVPAVAKPTPMELSLVVAGMPVASKQFMLQPTRPWMVHILPHSHVDIGYTHVQTEVERMQWSYFEQAIEIARRTAHYPPEARFKWNCEGLWAVDSYLKQAPPDKREQLIDAVRKGWLHLDGLYGNQLTGLCRPEELFRLLGCARRLSQQYDLAIDAAMISDVPGYTWGIIPVLAQSGIRYFSIGPNHCHRIGHTLEAWGDRPFYWVSPSGQEKVLCWMAGKAYSWFHGGRMGKIKDVKPREILAYLSDLSAAEYPYDMVQVRYSIGGDNGPPDPDLCDFVRDWNAQHLYPRLVISTTRELFREFERRHGDQIPQVRGDFTPYWEDGAASSAKETGLARSAAERLISAESLWAIRDPARYPSDRFYDAWRNVLLYNEHTWGAHCSISQPDSQFTKDQWAIKQAFALDADKQSKELLRDAIGQRPIDRVEAVEVYNLSSWPRSEVVAIPASMRVRGDRVEDRNGPVPSQRLQAENGKLWFLARDIPPFSAKRFYLQEGEPVSAGRAKVEGRTLSNADLSLVVDESTGSIASLTWQGAAKDLVDRRSGTGLNDYVYVPGRDSNKRQHNGKPNIVAFENGPLVASIKVSTTDAPGCISLERTYRIFDGMDRVDIKNVMDKQPIRTKESAHFGYPFQVPDGVMRIDVPWAVIRPELDQLQGACKNYLTVGRWVDVSNDQYGVTWATLDAPLIEVGDISVDVDSPLGLTSWITNLKPNATLYSYVMNNYWETNYKADQEGITRFRYSIRPHASFDSAAAARFGIERSQPLLVVPVSPHAASDPSPLSIDPSSVIVTLLKPAEDGKGLVLRLFNACDRLQKTSVQWDGKAPRQLFLSSPFEEMGAEVSGPMELPPWGVVTLRTKSL